MSNEDDDDDDNLELFLSASPLINIRSYAFHQDYRICIRTWWLQVDCWSHRARITRKAYLVFISLLLSSLWWLLLHYYYLPYLYGDCDIFMSQSSTRNDPLVLGPYLQNYIYIFSSIHQFYHIHLSFLLPRLPPYVPLSGNSTKTPMTLTCFRLSSVHHKSHIPTTLSIQVSL